MPEKLVVRKKSGVDEEFSFETLFDKYLKTSEGARWATESIDEWEDNLKKLNKVSNRFVASNLPPMKLGA
eukprot:gene7081-181_t